MGEIADAGTGTEEPCQIHLPGIRLSRFRVGPGERVRGHGHDAFHILCLLDGDMEQEAHGSARRLRCGGVRASAAGREHAIDFGGAGAECLVVHATDPARAGLQIPAIEASRFVDESGLEPAFQRLAGGASDDPVAAWLAVREIVAGLHLLSRRPEPVTIPAWLAEIRAHLLEPDAKRAPTRVSPEHLARAFRRYFGVTPSEVRRTAMLGRALALLRGSELPLVETALAAGFAHQSHLTNVMRRALGTTPKAYRRLHQG